MLCLQAILSTLMIVCGGITDLLNGASAAIWLFYILCFVGIIIMRSTYKQTPRPYKVCMPCSPLFHTYVK